MDMLFHCKYLYVCLCLADLCMKFFACVSQTLASAVVQLVLVSPGRKGQRSTWEIHGCGVACLVQDRRVHSAFIRLYSVKVNILADI